MQKIFYSILLLGATQIAGAQTQQNVPQRAQQNTPQDPQQVRFNTAIEYMNCRLGEFSMTNSPDTKLKNAFMQSCPCRAEGGTNAALSRFFQANGLSRNLRLYRSVDSLKNTYVAGTPSEQLASRLSGFLSSGTMIQFARNKTGYTDFSRTLAQEIEARFPANGAAPAATTNSSNSIGEPNDGVIRDVQQEKQSSFVKFFTYLITLLLGVLIGAVALRFWQRDTTRKKNTSSNDTQAAISTFFGGSNENTNLSNNNYNNNTTQITNLEQQITDLRKQTER